MTAAQSQVDIQPLAGGSGLRRAAWRRTLLACLAAVVAWALLLVGPPRTGHEHVMTAVLMFCSLVVPVLVCFRSPAVAATGGLDFCQPGAVVALFYYFYMVVPSLHIWYALDSQSNWVDPTWPPERLFNATCALGLLGLLGFAMGYHARIGLLPVRGSQRLLRRLTTGWPPVAWPVITLMGLIGLGFRLKHLMAYGGLSLDLLRYLSPSFAIASNLQIGGIPEFLESMFDWAILLFVLRSVISGKHKFLAVALMGAGVVLVYVLTGKRTSVMPFLFFPLVWYHYLRRPITLRRGFAFLGGGLFLMAALLFMRTLGPVFASGASLSGDAVTIATQPVRFYLNSAELSVFDMTMMAIRDRAPILHSIGGPVWGGFVNNLAPLAYLIPRFLWPTKPTFSDVGIVFFQRAVGDIAQQGFAVGVVGGLYLFGGVVGVALGMFLIGVVLRWAYDSVRPYLDKLWHVLLYSVFLWMTFMFLRFGTLGSTLLFFIQFQLVGVVAVFGIAMWRKPQPAS